jgi:hypothetical protein
VLEQPLGEALGALAVRHGDPEVHRRRAPGDADPRTCEQVEEAGALARVALAGGGHVLLVVPGDDRRPLDEFLRRRADRRPERLQRRDQIGVAGDEARAVAGHRGALGERVEHRDACAIVELERRAGRLLEPELAVGLVAREHDVVLAAEGRGARVEVRRRDGRRRVVRVVHPDDGDARPLDLGDRVEVGQEAVLLEQRQRERPAACEERAALVHRVPGLGEGDRVLAAQGIEHDLGEAEDRLLRAERGHDLRLGVERGAEAAAGPPGDRLA